MGPVCPTPPEDERAVRPDEADAAVGRLFVEHAASLVRLARAHAHDRDAAEDLVQEAFIRLRPALLRIDVETCRAAYVRAIVLNLARDHNRRAAVALRHRQRTEPPADPLDDEVVDRDERRLMMARLRALAPGQRDAVVLRYYLDLSVDEVAATLGVSSNTVKTQLRRGLANLARRLPDSSPPVR